MNTHVSDIIPLPQRLLSNLISRLNTSPSCLIAGAAMFLSYAPFNLGWLCFLLILPLLIACCHPNPDTRIFRGLLFGLGYFSVGSYWFAETLMEHIGYRWPAAIGGHLLITGACALAPTTFCWLAGYFRSNEAKTHRRHRQKVAWLVLLAALWIVIEDIRFQAFGGGPWMSLALSQIDSPLRGFLPILGETGTSGMVIVVGQLLLYALTAASQARISRAIGNCVFIGILMITGGFLSSIEWTEASGEPLPVAIVQTAVSQAEKKNLSTQTERLAQLSELSQTYIGKANLIIWPETMVTLNRGDIDQALKEFGKQAMLARSTVLVGAYERSLNGRQFNTAFTLGYEAGQKYQKRHLVPFGEYVPDYLWFLDEYVPGDQNRSLGREAMLIANSGVLFGVSICWEGSFSRDNTPLARAGAHVLVNIANEAWFAGSSLPQQNLDAMRVRALETGRPVIRVANYGPGAIINHNGKITMPLEANIASAATGMIQARIGSTPFVRLGADFILLWSFGLVMIIGVIVRKARTRL